MKKTPHPRKRQYVDSQLQGRLIFSMLLLQIVLIVGLTFYYRQQAIQIYDNAIYAIHASSHEMVTQQFINLFTKVLLIYVSANLFALWVAHLAWVAMIRRVISKLQRLIQMNRDMDLRESAEKFIHEEASHTTLDATLKWRETERDRWRQVKKLLQEVADKKPCHDNANEMKKQLRSIKQLLQYRSKQVE